ncbi:uncharacterized protein LOC113279185 [Papaver somniferum]|uniref:uncharacterized protein LOC113279185 n=1 Tax=Papaver somniferum TaxID=3469 RepID=UPI000E7048BF|nr:uncharacterized protein LOC113279185 [Papaver somniferum]
MAVVRSWWVGPICIGGDMNVVRSSEERNRGDGNSRNTALLNNYILEHELIDQPLIGGSFTLSNNQVNPLLCRLDHFLFSHDFEEVFPNALQVILTRTIPDHNPSMVISEPIISSKPYFKIDRLWIEYKDFAPNVKRWWEVMAYTGSASTRFFLKLENLKHLGEFRSLGKFQGKNLSLQVGFMSLTYWRKQVHFNILSWRRELSRQTDYDLSVIFRRKKFGMWCNKSPGPDNFTAEFFKNCWSTVKEDFMNLVKDFHRILSKLLANRLKKVMLVLISDFQGAIIHGKQILDGVLIANECVDSRLKARKPGILWKINMEKAFDNVNWQGLFTILQKHDFGVKWISWIKWCVTSTHLSLLVNGGSTENFKPSKGLRQGDSLSPYLFLLVVEILSKLINDAVERCQIYGFKVVDHDKSIMISVGADGVIDALARELGCKTEILSFTYLGMPIGAHWSNTSVWEHVLIRMEQKLASWKKRQLNKAGRLILIKSCLASLPIYYLSLFHLPLSVEKRMIKIMRNFLWGAVQGRMKLVWVFWKKLCVPKVIEGLGVKNLRKINQSLLVKWIWRFSKSKTSLWRKLVNEKFAHNSELLIPDVDNKPHGRSLWKNVTSMVTTVQNMATFTVRNGKGIRFWKDRWLDIGKLQDLFPVFYKAVKAKDATIYDMIENGVWVCDFKRPLNLNEQLELRVHTEIKLNMSELLIFE